MKVICINDNWSKGEVKNPSEAPKYMQIVEVSYPTVKEGILLYKLDGFFYLYEQENFAPLSDIDEMELVNERELINS